MHTHPFTRFAPLLASAFLAFSPAMQAQNGPGIFVTPIPNAPFSGTVAVERSTPLPNSAPMVLHSSRSIARDSRGRIYNELRPLVPANVTGALPVLSVHLYDPQTRISSMLYPGQRTFSVTAVNRPPETDAPGPFASPTGSALPPSQFAQQQDLGARSIAGIEVHGVRETQTIPADASGSGKEVVITDDYWYSSDLRMNLQVSHDDPRVGSSSFTVTTIERTEPDPNRFEVPADYKPAGYPANR